MPAIGSKKTYTAEVKGSDLLAMGAVTAATIALLLGDKLGISIAYASKSKYFKAIIENKRVQAAISLGTTYFGTQIITIRITEEYTINRVFDTHEWVEFEGWTLDNVQFVSIN